MLPTSDFEESSTVSFKQIIRLLELLEATIYNLIGKEMVKWSGRILIVPLLLGSSL